MPNVEFGAWTISISERGGCSLFLFYLFLFIYCLCSIAIRELQRDNRFVG